MPSAPRSIQALACCAGACLQSFCAWGFFNRRSGEFSTGGNRGNIQSALTPERWLGEAKDLPPGRKLIERFTPFLMHLATSGLSKRAIQNHVDNMWLRAEK